MSIRKLIKSTVSFPYDEVNQQNRATLLEPLAVKLDIKKTHQSCLS